MNFDFNLSSIQRHTLLPPWHIIPGLELISNIVEVTLIILIVSEKCFSTSEMKILTAKLQILEFYRYLTKKEAIVKITSKSLCRNFQSHDRLIVKTTLSNDLIDNDRFVKYTYKQHKPVIYWRQNNK